MYSDHIRVPLAQMRAVASSLDTVHTDLVAAEAGAEPLYGADVVPNPDFSCGFVWGGVGRVCGWGGVWVWVGPGRGVLSGCAVCVGGWGGLWAVVCPPRRCV